ncbi:MAG: DUF2459 domain-containing protein [Akkermansiaceae bacterium]|nr:DUF2459 domain-containing protein [Akkermansiaceae bacterium]
MRLALVAISSLLLCACSLRLPVEPYPGPASESSEAASASTETVEVWMHGDGYHTGLVFDYPWLVESGYIAPEALGTPRWVVVSWGNTDAYSAEGISGPHKWMQVLFTPTDSVMELIPINYQVPAVLPDQQIWRAEFPAHLGPRLAHFLNQCQVIDESGKPVVVRQSSWGKGVQLEGRYNYFIPRVCNIWSAQAIESLGGKIEVSRATTAKSLAKQLEKPENGFVLVHDGLAKD